MQVFSCDLVKSTLKVSAEGEEISFAYGSTKIIGSRKRGNIAYHHEMLPHTEDKQLRFNEGDNSYVILIADLHPMMKARVLPITLGYWF